MDFKTKLKVQVEVLSLHVTHRYLPPPLHLQPWKYMSTWNYIFSPMLHVNINMMKKNLNEIHVIICALISILKITKKRILH